MTQNHLHHQTWQKIADSIRESHIHVQQGVQVNLKDISAEVDLACQTAMALPAAERDALLDAMRGVVSHLDALEALLKNQKDLVASELSNLTQRGRAMSAYLNASASNTGNQSPPTPISSAAEPANSPADNPSDDSSPL